MPVARRTIKSMNRLTNKGHESTGRVGRCESRVSYPYVGYLFLLLASALLGLFVEALAYRSGWAAVTGVALGGSLVAAVALRASRPNQSEAPEAVVPSRLSA
jgi:hypothetical protein